MKHDSSGNVGSCFFGVSGSSANFLRSAEYECSDCYFGNVSQFLGFVKLTISSTFQSCFELR